MQSLLEPSCRNSQWSRHALAINSRICAAFCVLPVYNQLL